MYYARQCNKLNFRPDRKALSTGLHVEAYPLGKRLQMHFFQNTTTLAQLTLKPTAKTLKAAMNIACDILMEIAEKAAKLILRLVGQAVKLSSEAVDGAKFLAEKVGENIPDAATQIAQDIPTNYGKAAAVILGISGIAMVAAPAVLTLPALGAVGFSASRPIAGEFGYWGKTFRNGDKQSKWKTPNLG